MHKERLRNIMSSVAPIVMIKKRDYFQVATTVHHWQLELSIKYGGAPVIEKCNLQTRPCCHKKLNINSPCDLVFIFISIIQKISSIVVSSCHCFVLTNSALKK